MNKVKIILIIAGMLLIVGVIGMVVTFSPYYEAGNIEESETKRLAEEDISALQIKARNTNIYFQPAGETEPRIEYTATGRNVEQETFEHFMDGETLIIEIKRKLFNFFKVDLFFQSTSTLHVFLPAEEWENIEASTINGSLEGERIDVSALNVHSTNGRIMLDSISGDIEAQTTNGRIDITTESLDQSMDLKTVNGGVTIHSNQKPNNVVLDLRTVNGSTKVFGTTDWDSMYGNGEHLIKARTTNGSISIE
ncbi:MULTISPECIES: DUF4097 family beta strand repeat-containing protein [Gracilibacillus]|uniref:DUF4097 family beta strand repeat-containing protein n=1 Tax=Gracilibacillus TaxID=74385 RepID=UPI0008264A43|nr:MULTISPECIES: DUF4097 family beta strand repeat-containing protein [Gracilibacillus]